MKNIFFIFTCLFMNSVVSNTESKFPFKTLEKKELDTKIKIDNIEYISFEKSSKFLLKKVEGELYTLFGISNLEKKDIYPAVFSNYQEFTNGTFIFSNNTEAYLFSNNFKILKEWRGENGVHKAKNYYSIKFNSKILILYDYEGNSLVEKICKHDPHSPFDYNISEIFDKNINSNLVSIKRNSASTYESLALFNFETKKYISSFIYRSIIPFGDGVICHSVERNVHDYYNLSGQLLKTFEFAKKIKGENLLVKDEKNMIGVYDQNFNVVIPFEFNDFINKTHFDSYLILKKGDQYQTFDKYNKSLFKTNFNYIEEIPGGKFIIQKGDKYGILNFKSEEIIPFDYDTLFQQTIFICGLKNNKWTILNYSTTKVLFDQIDDFQNLGGFDILLKKGKFWAIYQEYGVKSDFIYDEIKVDEGLFYTKINSKWGIYFVDDKISSTNEYDLIQRLPNSDFFIVSKNGKQGIFEFSKNVINPKIVLPIDYDYIGVEPKNYGSDYMIHALNRKTGETKTIKCMSLK